MLCSYVNSEYSKAVCRALCAAAIALMPPLVYAGDAASFAPCISCHQIGVGAQNLVGPPLNSIVNAPIAGQDYQYTPALLSLASRHNGWNDELLDAFLAKPTQLVPGTTMIFAGVADADERNAIIAYLKQFDQNGNHTSGNSYQPPRDPVPPQAIIEQSGDIAYGEYLASECVTCHQSDGTDRGIPAIIGWPRKAFISAMYAYRVKARENSVMQQISGALGDEELASLADYFAQQ